MTVANKTINQLATAETNAGGKTVVYQGNDSKAANVGTAIYKDVVNSQSAASTDSGKLAALNSTGVIDTKAGGTGERLNPTGNTASQYFGTDSSGEPGMHNLPSVGSVADNSITYVKVNTGAIAEEKDIFDNPTQNDHLVANKTLADALAERDQQLGAFWSDWSSETGATTTTIASTGNLNVAGLDTTIAYKNTGNVLTDNLSHPTLFICGTGCSGLPTLSSGTLRGGLLFKDSDNTRWFYPIDNPESPDGEEFFKKVGNVWQAVDYKGDDLRVHLHGLEDDSTWNPFAAHLIGGPPTNIIALNAFNGETAIAKRTGDKIYLLRAVYSTVPPASFNILLATQKYEININDIGITGTQANNKIIKATSSTAAAWSDIAESDLPTGTLVYNGTPSNSQIPVYNTANSRWQLEAKPSGGGGGSSPSITEETIYSNASGLQRLTNASLSSGKSFADYNEIYFYTSSDKISPIFSIKPFGTTSKGTMCFECGGEYSVYINANVSDNFTANGFIFNHDKSDRRIYKIIGRKF